MAKENKATQSDRADTRLITVWGFAHLLLFAAIILYLASNGRTNSDSALAVGLVVTVVCTIESFLLLRTLTHGPARRIVSRMDKEYAFFLACCLLLMILVLNVLIIFTWRRGNPSFTGILGGSVPFGMTLSIYILSTPAAIACVLLVGRVKSLHRLRGTHCVSCGYGLEPSSNRCPECGYPRFQGR